MYNAVSYENYSSAAWNNIIAPDDASVTSMNNGLIIEAGSNDTFINNVVVGATTALQTVTGSGAGSSGVMSSNPTFLNNIVVGAGTGFTGPYAGTLTLDYNLFYNSSNIPTQAHPITGNPLFTNSYADWHVLAGSPAIGAGTVAGPFATYSDAAAGTNCGNPDSGPIYPCTAPSPAISTSSDSPCSLVSGSWTCGSAGSQRTAPWDLGAYKVTNTALVPGDCNGDGHVNITDLSILLSHYNQAYSACDFNNDGMVNILDLSVLLSKYGT